MNILKILRLFSSPTFTKNCQLKKLPSTPAMKGVKDSLPAEQLMEPCLNGRIDSHCNKLFHNKWIFTSLFFNIYM